MCNVYFSVDDAPLMITLASGHFPMHSKCPAHRCLNISNNLLALKSSEKKKIHTSIGRFSDLCWREGSVQRLKPRLNLCREMANNEDVSLRIVNW